MVQEPSYDGAELLVLMPLLSRSVISTTKLKEFGYTKTQFIIFFALASCGTLTMSQVADYISSSKEQATRAVAPLVDEGLLERYILPENRTRVYIRLTEKGQAFREDCRVHFQQRFQKLIGQKITQEEKRELKQAAETMIRILGNLME